MQHFDILAFYEEGYKLGILLPCNGPHRYSGRLTDNFSFDGNTVGGFYTDKDPAKILQVIMLLKKYKTPGYGEHQQLLGLVIERELLNEPYAIWRRAYQTSRSSEREKYVGLDEWLAENGHPYLLDDEDEKHK